jgi:hypothetical protein
MAYTESFSSRGLLQPPAGFSVQGLFADRPSLNDKYSLDRTVRSWSKLVELRYLGFDQSENTRSFRYDVIAKGETKRQAVITADMALFLQHHIAIQEGPAVCAVKLTSDLERNFEGEHVLVAEDLQAQVEIRAANEAKRIEARRAGGRRQGKTDVDEHADHADHLPNPRWMDQSSGGAA